MGVFPSDVVVTRTPFGEGQRGFLLPRYAAIERHGDDMDMHLAKEIIACTQGERWLFPYFKDRYAFMLLAWHAEGRITLSESALRSLRSKPRCKAWFSEQGTKAVPASGLRIAWFEDAKHFVLSLGEWDARYDANWHQTSRHGVNLVLRLGFSHEHDVHWQGLGKRPSARLFKCWAHPIMRRSDPWPYRDTLAWVRIDLDLDRDEALIEEIQTDWLRRARRQRELVAAYGRGQRLRNNGIDPQAFVRYVDEVLEPYMRLWDEACLTAAVQFLLEDVGIGRIYYHSFDTGCVVKGLKYSKPPRSLYTSLPRRFGFDAVSEGPSFLNRERRYRKRIKHVPNPRWYVYQRGEPAVH